MGFFLNYYLMIFCSFDPSVRQQIHTREIREETNQPQCLCTKKTNSKTKFKNPNSCKKWFMQTLRRQKHAQPQSAAPTCNTQQNTPQPAETHKDQKDALQVILLLLTRNHAWNTDTVSCTKGKQHESKKRCFSEIWNLSLRAFILMQFFLTAFNLRIRNL